MTVKQLLEMPVGYKTGGFDLTIKTAKKKWQVGKKWMHQIVLMDETGEIWADVNIGKNIPLIARTQIHITFCEIQDSEHHNNPCKKLYVDQFTQPAQIGEPPMNFEYGDSVKTIRSKIKCLATANMFDGTCNLEARVREVNTALNMPEMASIVDKIMEG